MSTMLVSSRSYVRTAPSTASQTIVVVPCYNEECRLPMQCFRDFVEQDHETQFCMVNDGSRDATLMLLYRLKAEYPDRFLIVNLPLNCGKAEAVRQGICTALEHDPKYVGYWDADLAAPLDAILQFRDVLNRRPETHLVIGTRLPLLGHAIERSLIRYFLGRLFASCATGVLGLRIYDTQCGHKLFRVDDKLRDVFKTSFNVRWIFDVELFARWIGNRDHESIKHAQDAIYELPLDAWRDVAGSKLKPFDFVRAFFELATIGWFYWSTHSKPESIPALTADTTPSALLRTKPEHSSDRRRAA